MVHHRRSPANAAVQFLWRCFSSASEATRSSFTWMNNLLHISPNASRTRKLQPF
uniref:Uncharacterized protein n=1 Tax=Arundo donax TaxID=35708 RepID=A0A0A9GLL7_ARUDO